MTDAERFLRSISTPKDVHSVAEKFGYKKAHILIKTVTEKGFADERDHKLYLNKSGHARLREIEQLSRKPAVQPTIEEFVEEQPANPQSNDSILWLLGIVGLFGAGFGTWKAVIENNFMPFGVVAILGAILLGLSILVLSSKK